MGAGVELTDGPSALMGDKTGSMVDGAWALGQPAQAMRQEVHRIARVACHLLLCAYEVQPQPMR
jgi:hypothetical protein